jgi:uncharacterized protein YgiM (DUF1202 family)
MDNDKDWDEDSYEVELEEKFEQLKSEHLKEAKKHNVQDRMSDGSCPRKI